MVIDRLILEGRLTQLALMQVFTVLPICLSPVIGIVNQLVHFAEVSELAGINFRHGSPPLVGVSYSYCQTWKYVPPSRRL